MIKNILVPAPGLPSDASVLETAFLVGRLFDSCLTCLHVRPDTGQLATMAATRDLDDGTVTSELFEALKEQDERRTRDAHAAFDKFCAEHTIAAQTETYGAHRVCAEWREALGDVADQTIAEGRFHDLIVLARANELGDFSPGAIGRILIKCGRPLLIVPDQRLENLAPTVAIAWKETPEAARAITAAMPLLAKAERVYVFAADEDDALTAMESIQRLAQQLRRHGFSVEAHCVVPGKRPIPDAILGAAVEIGADLLVMGGYSHSRAREYIFGGFTRHMLGAGRMPVFISH